MRKEGVQGPQVAGTSDLGLGMWGMDNAGPLGQPGKEERRGRGCGLAIASIAWKVEGSKGGGQEVLKWMKHALKNMGAHQTRPDSS